MHAYEIDGITYYAQGGKLYVAEDEPHQLEDLTKRRVYLYDGEVVKLHDDGEIYSSVEVFPIRDEARSYHVNKEEFEQAQPLTSLVPKDIEECPDCGSWAGDVDKEDTPKCFRCGYGFED